jgi:hypothetical protein
MRIGPLFCLTAAMALSLVHPLLAQEEGEEEDGEPQPMVLSDAALAARRIQIRSALYGAQNNAEQLHQALTRSTADRTASLGRALELTADQQRKLELGVKGDVSRYIVGLQALERHLTEDPIKRNPLLIPVIAFDQASRDATGNPINDGTFSHKVLTTMLTGEQSRTFGAIRGTLAAGGDLSTQSAISGFTIIIHRANFSDQDLAALRNLPRMESLILEQTGGITDRGFAALADFPALRSLGVRSALLSTDDLQAITRCRNLTSLELTKVGLDDDDLAIVCQMEQLERLAVRNNRITNAGAVHFARMTRLRDLDVGETFITDAGLDAITQLTNLHSLTLCRLRIRDAAMKKLTRLRELKTLNLDSTDITERGLDALHALEQPESISVLGTTVTEAAMDRLRDKFPGLKVQ